MLSTCSGAVNARDRDDFAVEISAKSSRSLQAAADAGEFSLIATDLP
jgi:hypothetical protein